ncbi:hypothetical protein QNI19_24255 [Cytophagaceae bacterium DM2B3-1]|uniref:Uncharacterized protein n=1 Tax=Xanthocytophaga flava TaxID=3048013 RepID=A0ABT7CRD3_9BACT|nr:hypothetical protein [Xanthocytophaga flavus]MDJ1496071.1 hypothetical protein [Xanthocytophaga flavus]
MIKSCFHDKVTETEPNRSREARPANGGICADRISFPNEGVNVAVKLGRLLLWDF